MKKLMIASIIALTASAPVLAESTETSSDGKRAGIAISSMATGALAGGPFGAMAGLIAAAWINEQVEDADQLTVTQAQLAAAELEVAKLSQALAQTEKQHASAEAQSLAQLQLEMLFNTDESQLSTAGESRLLTLVDYLRVNPSSDVRLNGHADPRGGSDYNLTLSADRAQSVASFLIGHGIDASRIETFAHGDSLSTAAIGDLDAYAKERAVKIELFDRNAAEAFTLAN